MPTWEGGGSPDAGTAPQGKSGLAVEQSSTLVVGNTTVINFLGGTVAANGSIAGQADVSLGGGGISTLHGGIGITISGTNTIGFSGNVNLPGTTSGPSPQINLRTGNVLGVDVYAGAINLSGGNAIGTSTTGHAYGANVVLSAGGAHLYGDYSNLGYGAVLSANRAQLDPGPTITGGNVLGYAGNGVDNGGGVIFKTGNAHTAGSAGSFVVTVGTGGTNGVFLLTNDPGTSSATSGVVYAEALTGILHRKP